MNNVLDKHSYTIADLADSCGINYNAIRPYLHQQTGSKPITRGIHKSKAYRGKVYCFINHIEVKGEKYPIITFGTHKHGGYRETFNAYREEMQARGYSDSYIRKQQPLQPKQEYVAPIESLEKWQITALTAAKNAFDAATKENVSTHDYIIKKGLNVDDCDIRRGIGKYGDCLMIAVVNSVGAVIGYQQIYAQNIKGKDTNKYFIGRTGGGFVVIGDKSQVPFGAIFCEGLATGLKIYHSNGTTKGELQNARKMPVIACLSAVNMRTVVADFVGEHGAENFKIYADNDCGKENGNTGIFTALEICKENGIKKYRVPVSENGAACDFADTLKFQDFIVPKNRIDYTAELLKVCPKPLITRCWKRYAYALIENAPSELRNADDCVNAVITATSTRGIDVAKEARNFISNEFTKRKDEIRKQKTITDFEGIERWNVDDTSPADVAILITMHNKFTQTMHFDNRGMGGNKTNTMIERAKHLTGGIAYISPLVSVCKNSGDRLGFLDYQSPVSADFINAHSHKINLSICINSIPKYDLSKNFSHLFIDEAAAVYAAIFDDTGTNSTQQATLIKNLREAFQAAQSILIADAGLSDVEVAFFKSLASNKRVCLIETTPKLSDKNHWLLKNHSHSHELILRDLNNGKRGLVACDTVANAITVQKYLIQNGIDENRILLATGENSGGDNQLNFIENPNQHAHQFDVVIHSPIIRSGTSIEYSGYSFTYLLYDGVIGTSDAMQMLGRNRCATDIYVSFGSNVDRTRVTDFEALLNADIESHLNQGYVLADEGLARLRHQFTANKNADLNDYKNNFMLFAEITGRNFAKVTSDIEFDAAFKKSVKEERIQDRFNAQPIDKKTYSILKDSNTTTQAQHNSIKRYETVAMVYGADNVTTANSNAITVDDVANEINGTAKILEKFETMTTSNDELKAMDKERLQYGGLKYSLVELQAAFLDVRDYLIKAGDNGGITRKHFSKACDKLEKHSRVLALAGIGDYRKINRVSPARTVSNFLEKIGYEIYEIYKNDGVRKYGIKVNGDIARYAASRAGSS